MLLEAFVWMQDVNISKLLSLPDKIQMLFDFCQAQVQVS